MDAQTTQLTTDAIIAMLASRQHGLVAYRQLLAAGIGRGAIEHRIRTGRLIRVQRGVYAVGHVHESALVRRMAAVLTCGDGAVLSHLSALAHWELRGSSAQKIQVTVRRRNASRSRSPATAWSASRIARSGAIRVPSRRRCVRRENPQNLRTGCTSRGAR